MDARAANDRIAEKAERLHFHSGVPMLCECGEPDCRKVVMIGLDAYREIRRDPGIFLAAPDHDADEAALVSEAPGYQVRRVNRIRGNGGSDRRTA
jgi:hypothetical protein